MVLKSLARLAASDYLKLLPILGLAFYVAFIPHQNYPYPLHVDEWVHMVYAKAMILEGSTSFTVPFTDAGVRDLATNLEAGFHLFWGVFQSISGISWLSIFRFFPGVISIITVLSIYIFAKKSGFGWQAAFFASLLPTTVGILGPAFMVPLSMALAFVPLCMYLVFNFRTGWSYLAIFIFTCFLLAVHAATAVGLAIIVAPYILLNIKGDFKHSLAVLLAVAIPFLAPFPWIFDMLLPTAKSLLVQQPLPDYVDLPQVIQTYGYLPVAFGLLGAFMLTLRGGRKNYAVVLALLAMLVMLVSFYSFHYGISIMYERGLMYMMLVLSIVAGAGLAEIGALRMPDRWPGVARTWAGRNLGNIICVVLIVVTLAMTIPQRQQVPYYQMIDDSDYDAFVWIKDHVEAGYDKAVIDPWKATAFTAITQRSIYTRIHAYPTSSDIAVYEFLDSGCTDTDFLRENDISIVYSRGECLNPDLKQVRNNIYLLEETAS